MTCTRWASSLAAIKQVSSYRTNNKLANYLFKKHEDCIDPIIVLVI